MMEASQLGPCCFGRREQQCADPTSISVPARYAASKPTWTMLTNAPDPFSRSVVCMTADAVPSNCRGLARSAVLRSGLNAGGAMAKENGDLDYERGWNAAILAARHWHEAQATQAMVLSRRTRFPKNLERDAEVHRRSAEMMATLSAEDV